MTLFNIGPLEFILILVIMFILLGPEGMIKTARQIGAWIRQTVRSPLWGEILGYSREIRDLPTKIVRDSGLEEDLKEIQKVATEATREAQSSLDQANQQISQSLKDTGSIEVKLDGAGVKPGMPSENKIGDGSTAVVESGSVAPAEEKPKPPVILD